MAVNINGLSWTPPWAGDEEKEFNAFRDWVKTQYGTMSWEYLSKTPAMGYPGWKNNEYYKLWVENGSPNTKIELRDWTEIYEQQRYLDDNPAWEGGPPPYALNKGYQWVKQTGNPETGIPYKQARWVMMKDEDAPKDEDTETGGLGDPPHSYLPEGYIRIGTSGVIKGPDGTFYNGYDWENRAQLTVLEPESANLMIDTWQKSQNIQNTQMAYYKQVEINGMAYLEYYNSNDEMYHLEYVGPLTGEGGLSADAQARYDLQRQELEENIRQFDLNYGLNKEQLELARQQAETDRWKEWNNHLTGPRDWISRYTYEQGPGVAPQGATPAAYTYYGAPTTQTTQSTPNWQTPAYSGQTTQTQASGPLSWNNSAVSQNTGTQGLSEAQGPISWTLPANQQGNAGGNTGMQGTAYDIYLPPAPKWLANISPQNPAGQQIRAAALSPIGGQTVASLSPDQIESAKGFADYSAGRALGAPSSGETWAFNSQATMPTNQPRQTYSWNTNVRR